jgi:putative DNA primase/helicase
MNQIERAASALNYLDAGCSREDWVRIGMAVKSAGLEFDEFHNWSKNSGNYTGEKDCRSAWKSFDKSGAITPATLFGMALAQGWRDTGKLHTNRKHSNKVKEEPTTNKDTNQTISAIEAWERCIPATSTEAYIVKKQGTPHGLRIYPKNAAPLLIREQNVAGYLAIPCWSNGQLQTLQFVPPAKGNKLNLTGASFNDGFFAVGERTDFIYICEGIGQAWAINKATGFLAAVCFGAGRLLTVAKVLRAKYPKTRLVVVPDRGKEKQAYEIAKTIAGQWAQLPQEKPSNYDVNDYAQEFGYEELSHLLARTKAPETHYKLLSSADLFNTPPMRWMVQGVIPAEGLTALFGESGSGKSFLILDMALAIAAGDAYWFGLRVTKAPVTYLCLEGESGIGKRIKAWNIYCNKLVPNELRFVTQPFNLLSDDVSELANTIIVGGGACGLIIIDTLNRAAPGADENSSVDMGNIIASAKKLQNLTGGVVLLVHHTGKDKTKGLRGHSSLFAALDGAIEVVKTDSRRGWSVAKSKDDVTGDCNPFKLEVVTVGLDDQGNEITSCIALIDDSNNIFQKQVSLGRNQKIALAEMDKQLSNSLHFNKEGAPPSKACLKYEEAILLIAEYMPSDSKHRKSRAISAIAGLVERKYLGMKGDWLWRI